MESIFENVPDLGDKIIRELDNQTLVKCREVQRSWYNFVNREKVLWFRMIKNYIGIDNEVLKAWRKVLRKMPITFVTQVAIATQRVHAKKQIKQYLPIHALVQLVNIFKGC